MSANLWGDGPIISGFGTILIGVGTILSAVTGWALGSRRKKFKASAEETDAITRRFQLLLDNYERRIKDLTDEVHGLRQEVAELRAALGAR